LAMNFERSREIPDPAKPQTKQKIMREL